jgi:hypothetical protein
MNATTLAERADLCWQRPSDAPGSAERRATRAVSPQIAGLEIATPALTRTVAGPDQGIAPQAVQVSRRAIGVSSGSLAPMAGFSRQSYISASNPSSNFTSTLAPGRFVLPASRRDSQSGEEHSSDQSATESDEEEDDEEEGDEDEDDEDEGDEDEGSNGSYALFARRAPATTYPATVSALSGALSRMAFNTSAPYALEDDAAGRQQRQSPETTSAVDLGRADEGGGFYPVTWLQVLNNGRYGSMPAHLGNLETLLDPSTSDDCISEAVVNRLRTRYPAQTSPFVQLRLPGHRTILVHGELVEVEEYLELSCVPNGGQFSFASQFYIVKGLPYDVFLSASTINRIDSRWSNATIHDRVSPQRLTVMMSTIILGDQARRA